MKHFSLGWYSIVFFICRNFEGYFNIQVFVFRFYYFTVRFSYFSFVAFHSSLHTTEAAFSPSSSHHPSCCSHLRPERVGGTTHDSAGEEPAGQIQAAAS